MGQSLLPLSSGEKVDRYSLDPQGLRFQAIEHIVLVQDQIVRVQEIEYDAMVRELREFVLSLKGKTLSREDADHVHALTRQLRTFRNRES